MNLKQIILEKLNIKRLIKLRHKSEHDRAIELEKIDHVEVSLEDNKDAKSIEENK